MEQWPASGIPTLEFIQNQIDQSDIVVLVSAGRYGVVVPDLEISYTEFEYEYAINNDKIVLVFICDNSDRLVEELNERDPASAQKLRTFHRRLITSGYPIRKWASRTELASEVVRALLDARRIKSSAGWVRLDRLDQQFADRATQAKIANLEGAVYSLWARLNEIRKNVQEHARQLPDVSESRAPCVSGVWECTTKFTIMNIHQRHSEIASRFGTGAFDHYLRGWWVRDHFSYEVWRINLQTQQFTIMQGRLFDIKENTFKTTVFATDGFQELGVDFRENLEWRRLETNGKASPPPRGRPRQRILRFFMR